MELSKERICNIKIENCNEEYYFKDGSPLFQILQKHSKSVFLYGEGGKGKTTAAQYLLLELHKENRAGYYIPLKLLKPIDGDKAIHKLFESIYKKRIEELYLNGSNPIIILDGINEAPDKFKKYDYFINECKKMIDEKIQLVIIGRNERVKTILEKSVESKAEKKEREFADSNMIYAQQQELPLNYVRNNIDVTELSIDVQKLLQNNYNFTLYKELREYDSELIISNSYDLAKLYYNVAIKAKFVVEKNSDIVSDVKKVYPWIKYYEYDCNSRRGKKWDVYCAENDVDRDINNAIKDINSVFKKLSQIAIKGSITSNRINDYFGTYIEELNHLSLIEKNGDRYFFASDKARDYFQTLEFLNWIKGINKQNIESKVRKCLNFLDSFDYSKHMYFTYLLKQLEEIVTINQEYISDSSLIYYHMLLSNNSVEDKDCGFQWHAFRANEIINNISFEELIMDQDLLPIVYEVKNNIAEIAATIRNNFEWAISELEYMEYLSDHVKDFESRTLIKIGTFEHLASIYYFIKNEEKALEYLDKTRYYINEYLKHSHNKIGKINQIIRLINIFLNEGENELAKKQFNDSELLENCYKLYIKDKITYKDIYVRLLASLCHFYINEKRDCLDLIFTTFSIVFESDIPMNEDNATDWILRELEMDNQFVSPYQDDLNRLSICAKACYHYKNYEIKAQEWDWIRVKINQEFQRQRPDRGRISLIQALIMDALNSDDQDEIIELYEQAFWLANTNNSKNQIVQKRDIATALITAYYERLSFLTHLIQYDIDGTMRIDENETIILDEKKKIGKIESEMWFYDPDYRYDIFEKGEIYIDSCKEQIYDVQADSDLESHRILHASLSILFTVSQVWCTSAAKIFPNQDYDKLLSLNSEIADYTAEELMNNLYKVYILLDECFRFVCTHHNDESQEIYDIISNLLDLLKKYELKYYCLSAYDMKNYFNSRLEEKHISLDEKEKINNIINRIETIWEKSQIT